MRIKTIELVGFKRFDDLTIDLGPTPKKIVAMVGPNGCGKSSIFDSIEKKMQRVRSRGSEDETFYLKSLFYDDNPQNEQYKQQKVEIDIDTGKLRSNSFYFRTSYRYTPKIEATRIKTIKETIDQQNPPISSIAIDQRLYNNYERLHAVLYS